MTWHQHNIEFHSPEAANRALIESIAPALNAAQLDSWWFVRKSPLKLRYRAAAPATAVTDVLTALVEDGNATSWCSGIYEPETKAFGGDRAMDIAHTLFHTDSHHLPRYASQPGKLGARETTVLLASALLRGAGQDRFEQGDVWNRLAAQRRGIDHTLPADFEKQTQLRDAIAQLMNARTEMLCASGNPLYGFDAWLAAFSTAGSALAHLARHGQLQRGLRAVLTHHLIFHANRAGLSLADQATIARLASDSVFAEPLHTNTTEGIQ